ncbi:MAG: glycoside hydrolase family 4 [Paenibacillus sp.]|jgi:alpha-galactosidase|nr:glycoside hydrolase family 4 [Paenibacillus sp.]
MSNTMILTVIGGGSVNWMRGLMRDVYLIDELEGGEIRLVDPNKEHVEAVAAMLEAFNRMRGKAYKIQVMEDRREALGGADFVMTTFSPGAMDAFWNDLELPIKYGIRQPVSMTVGPSGISASLRTAPVAYEIVKDMEELCPGAWLLNVTNPMSVVTRAMNLAAKQTNVVGLCHEFHCLPSYLGPILGLHKPSGMDILDYLYRWLPEQGFEYKVAGINHFIWLTQASLQGEDMLPVIRQYCKEHWEPERKMDDNHLQQATSGFSNRGAAKFALCRQFGYLPLAGDRHLVEFSSNLCNVRNGYAMKYGVQKTTVDARRFNKVEQLKQIQDIAAGTKEGSWERSGEEMVEIIKAVINKTSTVAIVNMPNQGQIMNMPNNVIVETLAHITPEGIQPVPSGELPGAIGSLCRLHADIHELTLRAALEGSKELFVEALSLDPLSGSADFSELPRLADELLSANREWLPRFFK